MLLSVPEHPKQFLECLQNCLPSFGYIENSLQMLDFLFKWLALKADFMLKRGVTLPDFEELRAVGLQFISEKTPQQQKTAIIQVLVEFKNQIGARQPRLEEKAPEVKAEPKRVLSIG